MRSIFLPDSIDELWEMLRQHPEAAVYAGGTDLLVRMRKGVLDPSCLICLERIGALKGVREEGDEIIIGACTSHARLLENQVIRSRLPVLIQALRQLGSPHIRNMGTIGGNIVTASPAGDTLPPLYALGAGVEIVSSGKKRFLPIKEFIKGPGKTDLGAGEIITGVRLKKDQPFNLFTFEKIGQRNALAISIASLAALLRVSEDGFIENAYFAWGSVGPTIVTSEDVASFLVGKRLGAGALTEAAIIARKAVSPIDDVRASASYRRLVSGNLLLRLAGPFEGHPGQAQTPLRIGKDWG